jgi:exodeoxyribonuclease III
MRIITWNVNGLRSVMSKNKLGEKINPKILSQPNVVETLLAEQNPDLLCLQEIRCDETLDLSKMNLSSMGYNNIYMNSAKSKKGYSGTAIFAKETPLSVRRDFEEFDDRPFLNDEGRVLTLEYHRFFVINAYVPNSKRDLSRLEYRVRVWEDAMMRYITFLQETTGKYIIYCGDLNVAATPIDVHNPVSAQGTSGYTMEEQGCLYKLLSTCNLVDTFREKNPLTSKYSWFSAQTYARKSNKGWRIDYVLASKTDNLIIKEADILLDYFGSDHIPCVVDLD